MLVLVLVLVKVLVLVLVLVLSPLGLEAALAQPSPPVAADWR